MRILVISDLYPPVSFGGYEHECAALVDALGRRHEVTVLTSDLDRQRALDDPAIRRELPYVGAARRQALLAPFTALSAAKVTREVLEELEPELVYVSNCLVAPQAAPCVALNEGYPVVFRLSELWFAASLLRGDRFLRHLYPGDRGLWSLWAAVVRGMNRHPDLRLEPGRPARMAVSWCSDDLRDRVALPPAFEPVIERTIYPATRHEQELSLLQRQPDGDPTIAYAGRVTVAKGAEVALHALAALRDQEAIEARLLFAGPCKPAMRRRLGSLARELRIESHVEFLGPLDVAALGGLLQRARAVVVPSIEPEAFPIVCMEAALARAPVVASRIGGIPEGLRDGTDALLFEPGDARACAAALAATLRDRGAADDRVANAFARMRGFSLDRYVAASERLIEDAMAGLGHGRRPVGSPR